jgi:hypothetical protein
VPGGFRSAGLIDSSLGDGEQTAYNLAISVTVASAEPTTSIGIKSIGPDDHQPKPVRRDLLAATLIVDPPLHAAGAADRVASVHDRLGTVMLMLVVLHDQPVARVEGIDREEGPATGAAGIADQPPKAVLPQPLFAKHLVH